MDSRNDWFDKLYLQYSPQMVSVAMRTGFTVEQAESITQEVFLLFLTEAPTVQGNHFYSPICGTCLLTPCGGAGDEMPFRGIQKPRGTFYSAAGSVSTACSVPEISR